MGVSVAIYRCTDHYTPGGSLQKLFSAPGKSGQGFTVFINKFLLNKCGVRLCKVFFLDFRKYIV
jgi:hypothetical protein